MSGPRYRSSSAPGRYGPAASLSPPPGSIASVLATIFGRWSAEEPGRSQAELARQMTALRQRHNIPGKTEPRELHRLLHGLYEPSPLTLALAAEAMGWSVTISGMDGPLALSADAGGTALSALVAAAEAAGRDVRLTFRDVGGKGEVVWRSSERPR